MEPDDALPASPCPRTTAPHHADEDSLAGLDVLYHNHMVQAAHHQAARRDMATQTEETMIVAPVILPDARATTRVSSYNYNADDDSLAGLDVLYHNRMVQATHQQAHRDMATQTEETIVAPELASAAEAFFDSDAGGGCRATPASADAVARLEKRRYDGDADAAAARCAICIEDFEIGDDQTVMPCSHRFHEGCIAKWLARSRLCPCCRHALPAAC
ncbi:unnamed protein product [Urochloa decumbens]|uniref:RING-type domain-containing protein n=1 Tax=Urochloa decumbens TaxID=240449 RepID=A0ABC9B7D2_9POAL